MPGFVIGSPLSLVGEAWIGAADGAPSGTTVSPQIVPSGATFSTLGVGLACEPLVFGPSASTLAPSLRRIAKPASFANVAAFPTLRATLVVKGATFANGQSVFAANLERALLPSGLANGSIIFGPRQTLRISASAYTTGGQVYAVGIAQGASNKAAPHYASSAEVFAPAIQFAPTTSVTVTLSLPGQIPRAPQPQRRRSAAVWPNLPKATAPPWRLTVVTPDIARERARQRMAALTRTERMRQKRKADKRADEIVAALIDETIARTIVDVVASAS